MKPKTKRLKLTVAGVFLLSFIPLAPWCRAGEETIIKNFIKKNIKAIKRLVETNQEEKIKQKLYNNGFSFQIINNTVNDIRNIIKDLTRFSHKNS